MSAEYSVVLWFPDGSYHYERRYIEAEEAVTLARDFSLRPAAIAGMIQKIMIIDGGDCTAFLWEFGKGVTYPPRGPDGSFVPDDVATG